MYLKRKRRGSSEFLYLLMVLALTTTIIINFNSYSRNIIKINEINEKYNSNYVNTNNVTIAIAESIKSGEYEKFKKIDGYKITTTKLTNNLIDSINKKIEKNYKNTNVILLKKDKEVIIDRENKNDYFLFSTSKQGISIGYTNNSKDYSVGEINNVFYYGIERGNTQKSLYINSLEDNSKLICFEFETNNIIYDFFVSKIEKDKETYYSLYATTADSIIEIYNFNDKGGM